MHTQLFHSLPQDAVKIRETVFVQEQSFQNEFDAIDSYATHIVLYDGDCPVGTCRFYADDAGKATLIGRIAVIKSHRGQHLGATLLGAAEAAIRSNGGALAQLHAQCRAQAFYEKQGYQAYGDIALDEGCPHIWMKKLL